MTSRPLTRVQQRITAAMSHTPGDATFLVAISGGADSTCLVHAFAHAAKDRVPGACFVDHGLRPEVELELDAVHTLCEALQINLIVRSVDTPALMQEHHLSLEVAARQLRYAALRDAASQAGAGYIVLGHTSDDQVETVLMHEFRGAGLKGTGGMQTVAGDLFRPLLSTSHAETVAYCQAARIGYVDDPSNDDQTILRNRLRHDVIPNIEAAFPGASEALVRLAQSSRRDVALLEELARESLNAIAPEDVLIPELWAALPESLRYHVLRLFAQDRGKSMSQRELDKWAADLMNQAHGHTMDSASLVTFNESLTEPVQLRVPGRTELLGVRIDAVTRPRRPDDAENIAVAGPDHNYLDAGEAGRRIAVRSWRPGDRMHSLGAPGSRKLQDIFVDRRVPRELRSRVAIVVGIHGILWAAGVTMADSAKVVTQTQSVLDIRIVKV